MYRFVLFLPVFVARCCFVCCARRASFSFLRLLISSAKQSIW
jgi:hypothetical protein